MARENKLPTLTNYYEGRKMRESFTVIERHMRRMNKAVDDLQNRFVTTSSDSIVDAASSDFLFDIDATGGAVIVNLPMNPTNSIYIGRENYTPSTSGCQIQSSSRVLGLKKARKLIFFPKTQPDIPRSTEMTMKCYSISANY